MLLTTRNKFYSIITLILSTALLGGMLGFQPYAKAAPTGTDWVGHAAAADNQWTSITYGEGLFVAVFSRWSW